MESKIFDWIKKNLGSEIWKMLPSSIDDKQDWIKDSYKSYEKKYAKYNVGVCDAILKLKPNEPKIIKWLNQYQNNLEKIENENPTPITDLKELIKSINNAFFRLESIMNGIVTEYKYFGFNDAFTILFIEARKLENLTYENNKLIANYLGLTEQIRVDFDKSNFINGAAYENEQFCTDCKELTHLSWERMDEFKPFFDPQEIAESERKLSINDIIENHTFSAQQREKIKKLSINQIALIYAFENGLITRKNSNSIAKEYGHNSGEKLFQRFIFYSNIQNRKGQPSLPTPKKFSNKINLFESVLEKLSEEAKIRATEEIKSLKILSENFEN